MPSDVLTLRGLRVEDEAAAKRAQEVLAREDFPFLFDFDPAGDFAAYVRRVESFNAGGRFSERSVPGAFLIAEVAGEIVGRLSVRYALDAYLARDGGHVGYCVLPSHRRRGYARRLLREGLELVWRSGADPVLVTCDEDNRGSRAVIERVGGRFVRTVAGEGPVTKRHYEFRRDPG